MIEVQELEVESDEGTVRVHLAYRVLATGSQRTDVFEATTTGTAGTSGGLNFSEGRAT